MPQSDIAVTLDRPLPGVGALPSAARIVARIERLPVAAWHAKVRLIVGTATFFDAFDTLAIAFVIPVLIGLWHLNPGQIGVLISTGFAGQFVGAVVFGWVGERYGRISGLSWTIAILSVFGLACGFATSYQELLVLRFIQGLGLGGEIPVAATYMNEIAKAGPRGRFVLWVQCVYPFGIMMSSFASVWIVPHLGWQWMFVIGALPALLIWPLRRMVPESPRWLARKGRLTEADTILTKIEDEISKQGTRPLPPVPTDFVEDGDQRGRWKELLSSFYRRRTISLWVLWFCAAALSQVLQAWLPTILRTVYKLPVSEALLYNAYGYVGLVIVCVIAAFTIDVVGRRALFLTAFASAGVLLFAVWLIADRGSAVPVMVLASIASTLASIMLLSFNVYGPEIYPTRMRSLGTGTASSWARISAVVVPSVIGWIMHIGQFEAIFLLSAAIALIATLVAYFFVIETKGRPLEEISP
jgi:putative MFS transporter